jgi:Uncharacterized conserved protein
MTTPDTNGGCLCGAIRYRATGQPIVSMVCHCRTCRKAAGSPLVAWLTFPVRAFTFVRGQPSEFSSSPPVKRTFCPSCGTPLTYTHADRPAEIDVTTVSIEDPEAFPPDHHSWVSHSLSWVRLDDGLPAYSPTSNDA